MSFEVTGRNLERQRARAARRAALLRYVPTADELADRLVASGDLNDAAREAGQPVEEAAYEVALAHLAASRDSAAELYAQLAAPTL